ncbi:hypothetical protein K5I29_03580 [Flavobacterium agricola]|uniref:Uncharacterized protein n=1 Tax=Flavobacterium agricola TaxID=2870839 RepID=A0ABY6M2V0_9FLAO|nr:hypothetical protein [Flavobacterium agricola]UYW02004.1 hypothetical protein K5I29_03580 [Flavobacterium agricola]
MHSISQGIISGITGGSFETSFVSAMVSSVVSSGVQLGGVAAGIGESSATTILFGTASGAIAAKLTNGNVWQGAAVGFFVSALNHGAHQMIQKDPIKKYWDTNGDNKLNKSEADNHWLNGNGEPITVDNRFIDWSGLNVEKLKALKIGGTYAIETHEAFIHLKYETAATYGGTSFIKTGVNTIEVQDQMYHYNYRNNNSIKNIIRNIMTRVGLPVGQRAGTGALYSGTDYKIHYENRSIKISDLK